MRKKRIGLVSTFAPGDSWPEETVRRVAATHQVVKKTLEDMGYEVEEDGEVNRTMEDMVRVGRELRYRNIQALVLYVGTWTYANCAAALVREAGVPVVIWADAAPGTCGLVGGAIARGGMDEFGFHANLVYGPFADPETREACRVYLDAACAVSAMRGEKLGLGGGTCMGMVTAVCDPNAVREIFGVEIETFEQMEIVARAEKVEAEEVEQFYRWVEKTFGGIVTSREAMEKQIRLYLAMKQFCRENHYSFVTAKCLPEMANQYTSFCLCHSMMGDREDAFGEKERMVFGCEADINAALTMELLHHLQEGPVMFTDLSQYDYEERVLTTCNCGSQPTDFARSKKEVIWEREGVHEHYWKYGGCCPQYVTKEGRVTMARLNRKQGRYEMLIVPARAVYFEREKLKETIWERPHAYFELLCKKEAFFSEVRSNHIHVVYGSYEEELKEICRILGLRAVCLEAEK